jgi:5-methylcytosine-specific restriction endonuclease McrA
MAKTKNKKYNPYGKTWPFWSSWIIKKQNYSCGVCGCKGYHKYTFPYPNNWNVHWQSLTPHHIIPVVKGGMNNTKNLIAVCGSCHRKIHCGTVTLNG